MISLNNKVVIITGGYGYLGKHIAQGFIGANAQVYIFGLSNTKFNAAFDSTMPNLNFIKCDLSRNEEVKKAFKLVHEAEGRIDVLINNAHYGQYEGQMTQLSDESWNVTLDGTIGQTYRCSREVIPYFMQSGNGRIINVASMYGVATPDFNVYEGLEHYINPPHYGCGKAAIIHLTKYLAGFLGSDNIYVNCISPGPFPDLHVQKDDLFIERLSNKTALGRIGKPHELIGVFLFLASNYSSYITGQNLCIDGGWGL